MNNRKMILSARQPAVELATKPWERNSEKGQEGEK